MSQTGFTPQQKAAILLRDGYTCPMCYRAADEANHRANRGSGGFKGGNRLSNGCAICHECNGRIEDDPEYADLARARGVKLSRYDDPLEADYLHPTWRVMVRLLDSGDFRLV